MLNPPIRRPGGLETKRIGKKKTSRRALRQYFLCIISVTITMLFLHIYKYRITHLYSRLLSLNVFWLRIWIFVVYSYQCIHMYIEIVWRSVVYGVYTVFGVGDQWTILEAWHVEGEWGKPGNREQKIKVLQTLLQRLWTFQCLRQEWSSWREAPIFWFLSYIHTNVYIYTYRDSFVSERKKSFADTSQLTLDIAMFAPGYQ